MSKPRPREGRGLAWGYTANERHIWQDGGCSGALSRRKRGLCPLVTLSGSAVLHMSHFPSPGLGLPSRKMGTVTELIGSLLPITLEGCLRTNRLNKNSRFQRTLPEGQGRSCHLRSALCAERCSVSDQAQSFCSLLHPQRGQLAEHVGC